MKIFQTNTIQLVKKSLDVYTQQHAAIAKNIANANRDEYKRVNTDFTEILKEDLDRTLRTSQPGHISESKTPVRLRGNNTDDKVDISKEMGELALNQIQYDFAARALAKSYKALNLSIIGRNS